MQTPLKLNYRRTFLVGLAFMSISAFWQMYDNVIPLILKYTFSIDDTLIGVVMAMDNVLALVLLPVFGRLSDKTRTRIGRRMPYILVGTAVALACLVLLPAAQAAGNLPLFFVGLGLVLVAMATYRSPAVALMPDVTPKPLRSQGNAVINLMGAVGGMLMLLAMQLMLPAAVSGQDYRPNYAPLFLTLGIVMAVCVAVLLATIREVPLAAETEQINRALGGQEAQAAPAAAGGSLSKAHRRSLWFILASVALWFFGYNAVTSGFSRYATEVLGGSFSMILMVCTAAAIVSYIPVGIIASRIGRKKTILIGVALLGSAFLAAGFFRSVTAVIYIFFIMAGMGWAFINVNSYPMVVELASAGDTGQYTGYYYTVSMASQIATPIFSGFLMGHVGYWTLFPYATLFVWGSFVTMLFVKHGDSKPQAKRGLEALDVDD